MSNRRRTSTVASFSRHFRDKQILPGVTEFLDALKAKRVHSLGLLTGNPSEGARIKLEPFGLNQYFGFGALGEDHEDRK